MATIDLTEARKPPANRGPTGGIASQLVFAVRKFLDLQVSSVFDSIRPWLAARSGSLLEVGCGDQPYRWLVPAGVSYTGIDWQHAGAGFSVEKLPDVVYYDGAVFPCTDAAFTSVMHTEVLEHVVDVRMFLAQCFRVLKPGGEMMFTTPFQARFHFIPHDYWRFTPSGLTHLLTEAGFVDIKVMPRGTDIVVAAYKVVSVFYRVAYGSIFGKFIFLAFSWLVVLLLILAHACMRYHLGSTDDCIGYTVTARRPAEARASNKRDGDAGEAAASDAPARDASG